MKIACCRTSSINSRPRTVRRKSRTSSVGSAIEAVPSVPIKATPHRPMRCLEGAARNDAMPDVMKHREPQGTVEQQQRAASMVGTRLTNDQDEEPDRSS